MKRIVLTLLLACCSGPTLAGGTLRDEAATLALSNRMMETAMVQAPDAVFGQLKPYWPLDPAEIDGMSSNAKLQWQLVASRFGKPLGFELVSTERIGQSFVRYVYLQKFEHHAIRWYFSFYRPKTEWIANSFKFDDQLDYLYVEE